MLDQLKSLTLENIPNSNPTLTTYFSLSTNEKNATNAFDTNAIIGQLIGLQLSKKLDSGFDITKFIDEVLEKFKLTASSEEAVAIIKKIYFADNKLPIFTPLMYMSRPYSSLDTKTKKSLNLFGQMLQPSQNLNLLHARLNFLEQQIFDQFQHYIVPGKGIPQSHSYVSYLDEYFTKDFNYLLSNPVSFQNSIDTFLKFYLFSYSAQLTLNVQTTPFEEPALKPLYFILNHEQASTERKNIVNNGYKTLIEKVRYLFPYLSFLEFLSGVINDKELKLFHLTSIDETAENIQIINNITTMFRQKRSLPINQLLTSKTVEDACKYLLQSAFEQFKRSDKKAVIDRFIAAYEKQISGFFIQLRGRSGKVLVLDQDTILLLTNLAINTQEKLRFQDLLIEFENRGVFFDPRSEDVLLELYERVGNIERKSDSGDAVYVRSI